MKIKLKTHKGITLISLVVTIIVLLILTGVVLTTLTGENGILSMAKNAREKTIEATEKEEEDLKKAQSLLEGAGGIIEEVKTNGIVTSRLVADGKGGSFYLPVGFYYVGGIVENGVVISDNSLDDGKYAGKADIGKKDLVGNQYVWIPVDNKKNIFAQHEYHTKNTDDTNYSADNGNEKWPTRSYRNYTDWTNGHYTGTTTGKKANGEDKTIYNYTNEMSENIASVEKYGGFYIGRYEAGWEQVTSGITSYNSAKGAGETRVPSSKYGYSVWNTISQINSSLACDRLDASAGYENVRARLIDGYAWDSTIYYIKDSVKSITDSRSYGNYTNGIAKESGVLGKYNLYRKAKEGGEESWICFGIKYRNIPSTININLSSTIEEGTSEMDIVDTILAEADTSLKQGVTTYSSVKDNYQYRIGYELTTGGAESTKIKNIYDLAGNMFEWTAEYGEHKDYLTGNKDSNEKYFAVVRGG